jgi:hypothetical protein
MWYVVSKKAFLLISLSLLGLLASSRVDAEEIPKVYDGNIGQAVYSEGQTKIEGLKWTGENGQPDFTIEAQKNGKPAARLNGRLESKNAGTLLFSSDVIQRAQFSGDSGNFTVLIPLNNRKTAVKVQYIDDYGNKKSQDIEIVYENFYQFQLNQQTKKKWNFDGGLSISYLDFLQSAPGVDVKITQVGLTPKLGVTYNWTERLDIGGSVFGTAIGIPLSKSPDGISTPRFYGINMRIGYKIYGLKTGNIYLMTGPYFWGMIVPPSVVQYGVVKLSGPQLFLVGRFLTGEGRTTVGYIKVASILDGSGGTSKNHEFAIGGAYQITPPKAKRRIMMNLDFAFAKFKIEDKTDPANPVVQNINLNSISLGFSTPL